jgi:hypothetical protein
MLADTLATVRRLDDVGRLFVELGYQPDDRPAEDGLQGVARWKTFRVLAAESPTPRETARAGAHRLAGSARPGLVAALGDGHLAVAAPRLGAAGSSPVLTVSTAAPDAFGLRILADLAPRPGATALEHALRVADILATEEVGVRFFTGFRAVLERMTAACGAGTAPADRTLAALLALVRVLFLYFVQAKGWLDGEPDFLRTQLDGALARRRHFHRSVLHPLFFGTLNRPPAARTHGARFGRIPYLNGGLFEPHPVERRLGPVLFPNALWRDAFDDLFERFRFCVREGDDAHAIAPDMLGRVFERVMEPGDRQTSGTFYTPERLVRRLVAGTLATALASDGFPADAVRRLLRGDAPPTGLRPAAHQALRSARIVDPAAGSGAFLLGALEALTTAWLALEPNGGPAHATAIRRRIIRDNLFGVDVSPVAVRLAELRLWLAVVADDPETDAARVTPLPNLNGVLRQGDTLLDPVGAAGALGLAAGRPAALDAVRQARDRLFEARGAALPAAAGALRSAEIAAARQLVDAARARTRAALQDLEAAAQSPDLFGRRSGLTTTQRRRQGLLEARLADLDAARRRAADGSVPYFSFEVHRPDVMSAGGFTAVIGNPPWVRAERLPAALRGVLRDRFTWWRPEGGRRFGHLPDLSVAFLERCLELAAPGGAVGLLVPSKLTSSGYAERARAALVRETSLAYLHRVPDREAAGFGASVYPLAIVARKAPPQPDARVRLDFEEPASVAQASLATPGPWVLLADRAGAALETLRRAGPPLDQVAPPALGLKTGADQLLTGSIVREDDAACVVRFGSREVAIEPDLLRPALRGRDVKAFRATARRVVLWGYDRHGSILPRLPPRAARYVRTVRAPLLGRSDHDGGPPWSLFRIKAAAARWRVTWADIAREPGAVALDEVLPAAVPLNTCYVAACPDRETALLVAAVLNSTWTRVLIRATADEAQNGYRRHNARITGVIPLPATGEARDRVVALSRAAHRTGHVSQPDLDRAIADALGLPADVRAALAGLARDPG